MHSNTTNEIAVGATGMLLGVIAFDDPTVQWLAGNWLTLLVVAGMTMTVAGVTCLLSPAPSPRMTVGRILASGIFGAVISVVAGAIHSNGSGPAAIAGIILVCGIGGWMGWLLILEVITSMKESPEARKGIISILQNFLSRFTGQPRSPNPMGPIHENPLPPPTTPPPPVVKKEEPAVGP